jgi:hypothetical protein
MINQYFSFAGSEQSIEIEQDRISKDTTLRFHPCEKVVETVNINKQEFENAVFKVLKDMYFKDYFV